MIRIKAGLVGTALVAVGLKLSLLASGSVPFNADEAVVALMARHILQGERPVFFYGQAYMGSLDAYLVAGGFWLFGEKVWVLRGVQGALYLATLLSTAWLGKAAFGSWKVGMIAAWLLAIPTVNLTLYTTATLGGYGEMLLVGNLILLAALRIANNIEADELNNRLWIWLAFGFLIGLGGWVFGMTLVYSVPACLFLIWRGMGSRTGTAMAERRSTRKFVQQIRIPGILTLTTAGVVFGSAPWWIYARSSGLVELLKELGGGAIAGVEGLSWPWQVTQHLFNLLVFGSSVVFGLRSPWEIRWLAWPLSPIILAFWLGVVFVATSSFLRSLFKRQEAHNTKGLILLMGVVITLVAGFLLTPFGADPSGRYFLPLGVIMALFAAQAVVLWRERWGRWSYGLVGLVLVFNLWGTVQTALDNPPGLTTQFDTQTWIDHRYDKALVDFLRSQGEQRGYSNYWVSYPLAFQSGEDLIFVPRLPYHLDFRYTARDDRYKPYDQLVDQAEHLAYITTHHPELDKRLRTGFTSLGVAWKEATIGDYHIFYGLSRKVRLEELNLGW